MIDYYKKCCLIIFIPDTLKGMNDESNSDKTDESIHLRTYEPLVNHTIIITGDYPVTKHLYYNKEIGLNDNFNSDQYKKYLRKGDDIGIQMQNAFQTSFDEGYRKVILISSNCMELEKRHLEEAFLSLKIIEFCIGPDSNGGYYLIGMNQFEPTLFHNKDWNSPTLCKSTIRDVGNLKAALYKLPILNTI